MEISTHADYLEAARARLAAVATASAHIAADDGAFGVLCRWICDDLDARHAKQDELLAFLDENLRRLVARLRAKDAVARPTPRGDDRLVAPTPSAVGERVQEPGGLAPIEQFSSALSERLRWTMEHVGPLPAMLDDLTGKPGLVRGHASTWENVAFELYSIAEELQASLDVHVADWRGKAADEHRNFLEHNIEAIGGLAAVSAALGEITAAAAGLVELTRGVVRGLIADLAARMTVWTEHAAGPVSLPVVAGQLVTAMMTWAGRILTYAVALAEGVVSLTKWLNG